jgi:hypothetical protein
VCTRQVVRTVKTFVGSGQASCQKSEVALVVVFVDKVPPPFPTQSEQAISLRARINALFRGVFHRRGVCACFHLRYGIIDMRPLRVWACCNNIPQVLRIYLYGRPRDAIGTICTKTSCP